MEFASNLEPRQKRSLSEAVLARRTGMICRRHSLRRQGFTLIEVVIALAILGIGLTVIIELFSGGLRLGRVSGEYTWAVNYARMKMEEIAMKPDIQEGTEEGEFDPTYRWQVGVKKMDLLSPGKDQPITPPVELFQVKVNVLWKSGSKERSAIFETYRTQKRKES